MKHPLILIKEFLRLIYGRFLKIKSLVFLTIRIVLQFFKETILSFIKPPGSAHLKKGEYTRISLGILLLVIGFILALSQKYGLNSFLIWGGIGLVFVMSPAAWTLRFTMLVGFISIYATAYVGKYSTENIYKIVGYSTKQIESEVKRGRKELQKSVNEIVSEATNKAKGEITDAVFPNKFVVHIYGAGETFYEPNLKLKIGNETKLEVVDKSKRIINVKRRKIAIHLGVFNKSLYPCRDVVVHMYFNNCDFEENWEKFLKNFIKANEKDPDNPKKIYYQAEAKFNFSEGIGFCIPIIAPIYRMWFQDAIINLKEEKREGEIVVQINANNYYWFRFILKE